jgi:hypothetical protein
MTSVRAPHLQMHADHMAESASKTSSDSGTGS